MQKKILFLVLSVLVSMSAFLLVSCNEQSEQYAAETFLNEIHSSNRYLNSDEVAKRIINDDPTLFLVDVRNDDDFANYSLPGAINIPLENLLDESWKAKLDQDVLDVIFFSNDDIVSEQAWAICKQVGYSNLYVLDGGLNQWFSNIMLPVKPDETASTEEWDLYSFRTGASIYFGSGTIDVPVVVEVEVEVEEKPEPEAKKTIPVKKKVKVEAEGGC